MAKTAAEIAGEIVVAMVEKGSFTGPAEDRAPEVLESIFRRIRYLEGLRYEEFTKK